MSKEPTDAVTPLMLARASVALGRLSRAEPDLRVDGLTDDEIRGVLAAAISRPLPTEEEVARVIYPEAFEDPTPTQNQVYRCMGHHEARADALARAATILSMLRREE